MVVPVPRWPGAGSSGVLTTADAPIGVSILDRLRSRLRVRQRQRQSKLNRLECH